ncbi:hypothetical protein GCM10009676_22880 [Prauserella halophila]|uniref:Uncharacterized protein n=1 Tax=Prauserella halophila TaxID=185641 RepID=A0ABP4GTH7_9PSEU
MSHCATRHHVVALPIRPCSSTIGCPAPPNRTAPSPNRIYALPTAIRRAGPCVLALVCTLTARTSGGDGPRTTTSQYPPAAPTSHIPAALQQQPPEPGATGIGDPYYPAAGDGG